MVRPFLTFDKSHTVEFTSEELLDEQWLPLVNFEDAYQVSNLGRIRSNDRCVHARSKNGLEYQRPIRGKYLHPGVDDFGYEYVSLSREGQSYFKFIHRAVLEAFCPVDNSDVYHVNHKNYNRRDNRISNLEWCTVDYNNEYSYLNCFGNDSSPIPVVDLTTNTHYSSLSSAVADLGYRNYESLRLCIEHKKLFKGHVFIFESDISSESLDAYVREVIDNSIRYNHANCRPMVDLTTGVRFSSVDKAVKSVGGTGEGVVASIRKHRPYKHHVFVYEDQLTSDFDTADYINKAFDGYVSQKEPIKIKDIVSGVIYDSINRAAVLLNIDSEKVRLAVRDQNICDGHLFVKVTDLDKIGNEEEYFKKIQNIKKRGRSIPIVDLTTRIEYSSINQVYVKLGIPLSRTMIESHQERKGHRFAFKYE